MTLKKDFHKNACANCGHKDMHGEVAGCIGMTGPNSWCDCQKYVDPQPAPVARTIPSRRTDPGTSHAAAASVSVTGRNQRGILLGAFGTDLATALNGLTDEQAMEASVGVSPTSEYAKRCSELRDAGLILETGETRNGNAGRPRIVSAITDAGRAVLASL